MGTPSPRVKEFSLAAFDARWGEISPGRGSSTVPYLVSYADWDYGPVQVRKREGESLTVWQLLNFELGQRAANAVTWYADLSPRFLMAGLRERCDDDG